MRRLAPLLALTCASCSAPTVERRWLDEPAFRRAALEASLERDTAYASLRRAEWTAWQALPEWSPVPVPAAARRGDRAALVALGREAFFRHPVQPAPSGAREGEHGLTHLVEHEGRPWLTCATCHSDGERVGAPSRTVDLGASLLHAHPDAPAEARAVARSWGPGRVDVSSATGTEPARIPDLRPVRFQHSLQWSGAVRQHDVTSLAARLETLMITSAPTHRPPPALSLGLAEFLYGLADALPKATVEPLFAAHCAECHEGEGLAGDLFDVDELGTDPTLSRSPERGTGMYRATSLRGVGSRGPLLHDGSVPDLPSLLSPSRTGGHRYGLTLSSSERERLLAWLASL